MLMAAEKYQVLTGIPVAGVLHPTYVTRRERDEVNISSKIGYLPPPISNTISWHRGVTSISSDSLFLLSVNVWA
jgi:hypothetical protein